MTTATYPDLKYRDCEDCHRASEYLVTFPVCEYRPKAYDSYLCVMCLREVRLYDDSVIVHG
jgi:hypothetical protein